MPFTGQSPTRKSNAVTILGSTHGTSSAVWGANENAANAAAAVLGTTNGPGPGVQGSSSKGPGGVFSGSTAQVELTPAPGSHPDSGAPGQFFVDSNHDLWFCKGAANWVKLT
jgi:hypothetical protein